MVLGELECDEREGDRLEIGEEGTGLLPYEFFTAAAEVGIDCVRRWHFLTVLAWN